MPQAPQPDLKLTKIALYSKPAQKTCDYCHRRLNRYYLCLGYFIHYFCSKECADKWASKRGIRSTKNAKDSGHKVQAP